MKQYCEGIAAEAWKDLARSDLVTAEKLGKCPEVRFAPLGKKILGLAYADHIELNDNYLENDDRENVKDTLFHEIAHVAEYRCTGIMGHGPLWHAVCLYIGGSGNSRGDVQDSADGSGSESDQALFGFVVLLALGDTLFSAAYCAHHFLGIANLFLCVACGIGGVALSLVLWVSCCKTYEQLKDTVLIQASLSVVFIIGILI